MAELSFAAMPEVIDDDETPFVLEFAADPRPSLQAGGAEFRRGSYSYLMQWPLGPFWLRVRVEGAEQTSAVIASCGPILNDWWPTLNTAPEDPSRPFLSAGVAGRAIEVSATTGLAIPVRVIPPSEYIAATTAAFFLSGSITDETNLVLFLAAAMPVARAAVELLGEYRQLVGEPPDIQIATQGGTIAIADMLDAAAWAAASLHPDSTPA